MNIYSIIPLIATLIYSVLAVFLLSHRPWEKRHKLFAWYLVGALLWSISNIFFRSDFFPADKLFLSKINIICFMFMLVPFSYFVASFYTSFGDSWTHLIYIPLLATIVLAALGYMPTTVILEETVYPEYHMPFFLLFVVLPLLVLAVRGIFRLWQKLKTVENPNIHNQLIYLIICIIVLALSASSNIIPLGRKLPIAHTGNIIVASLLAYAILKHRLIDIKFILQRWILYGSLIIFISALYITLLNLFHLWLGFELSFPTLVIAAGITVLIAASFYPLRNILQKRIDQLFYLKTYKYRQLLLDFSKKASKIINLEELGKELIQLVVAAIGAQKAYLLLPNHDERTFTVQFTSLTPGDRTFSQLNLSQDNPIIEWLKRENKPLFAENLDILYEFCNLWEKERDLIRAAEIKLFQPLISQGKLIGILALGSKETSSIYDINDIELLQTLANEAAIAFENAQLHAYAKEREKEFRFLNELSKIITSSLDINQIYEKFIQEIRQVMDADWASIALIEGEWLRFFALSKVASSEWEPGETIPLKGTATAYIAKTKKTLVEPDLSQCHRFWTGDIHLIHGIRSIVYIPLISKNEVIGSLIIGSFRPYAYGEREIGLLEQVAGQLATAIENFRLYEQLQKQAITDSLTELFNRRYFEQRLEEEIARYSRYYIPFSVIISDLDSFKAYNDSHGHRAGDELLKEIAQIIKDSVRKADLCFRYGGDEFALILPKTTPENSYQIAERIRLKVAEEMTHRNIPVTISLGVASFPADGTTGEEIVRAADTALYHAKQTGGNQVKLFSKTIFIPPKTRTVSTTQEKVTFETIQALVSAVDAKDRYTYSHSLTVANYAEALAKAAGLPQDRIAILKNAALLHDVGKIGIPDELLNKEGKITAEEWETLKSHSNIGAIIISRISSLAPCLPIVLYHHERYDGKGYPKGIKGKNIPIEARILAIADAFAAMISPRPYRSALSYREAIEELKKGAGTQFDPELVELFFPIALSSTPETVKAKNPNT